MNKHSKHVTQCHMSTTLYPICLTYGWFKLDVFFLHSFVIYLGFFYFFFLCVFSRENLKPFVKDILYGTYDDMYIGQWWLGN